MKKLVLPPSHIEDDENDLDALIFEGEEPYISQR